MYIHIGPRVCICLHVTYEQTTTHVTCQNMTGPSSLSISYIYEIDKLDGDPHLVCLSHIFVVSVWYTRIRCVHTSFFKYIDLFRYVQTAKNMNIYIFIFRPLSANIGLFRYIKTLKNTNIYIYLYGSLSTNISVSFDMLRNLKIRIYAYIYMGFCRQIYGSFSNFSRQYTGLFRYVQTVQNMNTYMFIHRSLSTNISVSFDMLKHLKYEYTPIFISVSVDKYIDLFRICSDSMPVSFDMFRQYKI